MFNVVLVEPEIPANTGNIGRTCVVAGARLHLVRPLGFSLDAKTRRRAGLLYWDHLDVRIHDSWGAFMETEFGAACEGGKVFTGTDAGAARDNMRLNSHECDGENSAAFHDIAHKLHFATKKARKTYAQAHYSDGDYLVFGKESTGLSESLLAQFPDSCERIPMLTDADCGFDGGDGVHEGPSSKHNGDGDHASPLPQQGSPEKTNAAPDSPLLQQDICGNFVDTRAYSVNALNLSNSVAIMLYEALRQTGFQNMEE